MGVTHAPHLIMLSTARQLLLRFGRSNLPGVGGGSSTSIRKSFNATLLSSETLSHSGGNCGDAMVAGTCRNVNGSMQKRRGLHVLAALSGMTDGGAVSVDSRRTTSDVARESVGTAVLIERESDSDELGEGPPQDDVEGLVVETLNVEGLVVETLNPEGSGRGEGEGEGDLGGRGEKRRREGGAKGFFPKRGQTVELTCESLAYTGKGVCKVDDTGFVVMCERALPGERLVARIVKKKQGMAEAYKVQTLAPHDGAVPPPCPHFTEGCGGCKLQNLAYENQLKSKESQVADLVARVGRFGVSGSSGPSGDYMRAIVPCSQQYHYRNKMEFSFGTRAWSPAESYKRAPAVEPGSPRTRTKVAPVEGGYALGLHAPRRFDKVLPIKSCLLQHDVANQVLALVDEYCRGHYDEIPPYDVVLHEGFLRHLTIRRGRDMETGEPQFMVSFLTKHDRPELLQPLADQIVKAHPQVVSVLNPVNDSVGNVSVGVTENVLFGRRTITETLRGLDFDISVASFFQTNTTQADVLYSLVDEACGLNSDGSEVLLDLFCGTGTIGLSMARRVKHVYGYEIVPEAVIDARQNAERNGITNATFVLGDLNKLKEDFGTELPTPDVIITDPNRPGMHPKLLRFIARSGASRVVYVSCNPATCARDLDILCHGEEGSGDGGGRGAGMYKLVSVQPVDMFPHTPHIECVAVLHRVSPSLSLPDELQERQENGV